jgi:FtsP/CotA-like multicopper oxidase with cupredoxin domain
MKSRRIFYALLALAVLVTLVFITRPKNTQNPPGKSTQSKEYSFVLKNKIITSGPNTINVTEGDQVNITLNSDANWPELHLHGYELKTAIKKDSPSTIIFTANKTGSYVLEIHFTDQPDTGGADSNSGSANELQISHLEVRPK